MSQTSQRLIYLCGFIACAGLIAFAIYLQRAEGLEPCPLCIFQRLFYAAVGAVCLVGAIHGPRRTGVRVYSTLNLLLALGGAGVAARQVWLQHLPPDQVPGCGPGLNYLLQVYPLHKALAQVLRGTGDCAVVDWTFLGLSIAEWSLIIFALMAIVSLIQIARPGDRSMNLFIK